VTLVGLSALPATSVGALLDPIVSVSLPAASGRARTHVTDPLVAALRASRALQLETLVATPLASFSASAAVFVRERLERTDLPAVPQPRDPDVARRADDAQREPRPFY